MTFHKYSKIHHLDKEEVEHIFDDPEDEIIIEEKIDGANFRFFKVPGKDELVFGSRNQQLHEKDNGRYSKSFDRTIQYVLDNIDIDQVPEGYIIYGESCHPHSLEYDWENMPPFLGFDIRSIETGKYVMYDMRQELFEAMNLPTVPLIARVPAKDVPEYEDKDIPKSKYSVLQAEGVVFKNYVKQVFSKKVTDKFKEKNSLTFGGGRKRAESNEELFIATYVTNARIDKHIYKNLDRGEKLSKELIGPLIKQIWNDIWKEEGKEITYKFDKLNFKKTRNMLAQRIIAVLENMLENEKITAQNQPKDI